MKNPVLMLGGLCLDRYCLLSQFPVKGQDTLIQDTFERIGGCPINAAFTLKKFGLDPILYSAVGAESIEKVRAFFQRNALQSEGLFVIEDQKTGFCMILLDDQKERTFMTYRGCEGTFRADRVPDLAYSACCLTGLYLIYGSCLLYTSTPISLSCSKISFCEISCDIAFCGVFIRPDAPS